MEVGEALVVMGCTLYCHACGAESEVVVDDIPKVRVRLVQKTPGDVNKTTAVIQCSITAYPLVKEKGTRLSNLGWYQGDLREVSLDEYLEYQKLAEIESDEPVDGFEVVVGDQRLVGSFYYNFVDREDRVDPSDA